MDLAKKDHSRYFKNTLKLYASNFIFSQYMVCNWHCYHTYPDFAALQQARLQVLHLHPALLQLGLVLVGQLEQLPVLYEFFFFLALDLGATNEAFLKGGNLLIKEKNKRKMKPRVYTLNKGPNNARAQMNINI